MAERVIRVLTAHLEIERLFASDARRGSYGEKEREREGWDCTSLKWNSTLIELDCSRSAGSLHRNSFPFLSRDERAFSHLGVTFCYWLFFYIFCDFLDSLREFIKKVIKYFSKKNEKMY